MKKRRTKEGGGGEGEEEEVEEEEGNMTQASNFKRQCKKGQLNYVEA